MANMGAQVATQANGTKGEYDVVRVHAGRPEKVRVEVPNSQHPRYSLLNAFDELASKFNQLPAIERHHTLHELRPRHCTPDLHKAE